MLKPVNIKEILAYYNEADWAACGCELVRKFGISGASEILKAMREVISLMQNVQNITLGIRNKKDSLFGIFQRLVPSSIVANSAFQIVERANVCPMLSDILFSIGDAIGDPVRELGLTQFMQSKHDMLFREMDKVESKVDTYQLELQKLQNLVTFMEGCVSVAVSGNRTFDDEVWAKTVQPPQKFVREWGFLRRFIVGNVVKVGNENWVVYDEDSHVWVLRQVGNKWQPPIKLVRGSFPTIFFDGTVVRVAFTLNEKIQVVRFLPHQLGFVESPYQIWDCAKTYGATPAYPAVEVWGSCVGSNRGVGANILSFPDGGPGIWPRAVLRSDAGFTRLTWDALLVQHYSTRYQVFENNRLVFETTGTLYDELLNAATDYWVTAIYTNVHGMPKVDYIGCPSNVIRTPDVLGRVVEREWIGTYGNSIYGKNVIDYHVIIDSQSSSNVEGVYGGSVSKAKIIDYHVIIDSQSSDSIVGIHGSSVYRTNNINYYHGVIQ